LGVLGEGPGRREKLRLLEGCGKRSLFGVIGGLNECFLTSEKDREQSEWCVYKSNWDWVLAERDFLPPRRGG